MEVVKNRKLSQKILISILTALLLLNFILPTVTKATEDEYEQEVSSLSGPIQSLITLIGDAGMSLMQKIFVGNWEITERVTGIDEEGDAGYLYIPDFQISPESIFQGGIPAFDINFFSPMDSTVITIEDKEYKNLKNYLAVFDDYPEEQWTADNEELFKRLQLITTGNSELKQSLKQYKGIDDELDDLIGNWGTGALRFWGLNYMAAGGEYAAVMENHKMLRKDIIEIVNWIDNNEEKIDGVEIATRESSAAILQSTVSYWYNQLRNISIIGLLSVLVYIGIRIVISSTAADKSKYKEMLTDWAVAICLLFFMHYFMNFAVTITQSISNALVVDTEQAEMTQKVEDISYTGDRLVGDIRLRLQTEEKLTARWSYTIIYLVIVIYTIIFALMYLKRVIYMAFFTMMAPVVALTYPIDKARDGKAQAFDLWMKEYTFNALIQPFHLIIYYVLVGSAIDLAVENPLYALVAIGFMMPAEKLLRKFFGFNKSETSGALGGAFGGAMIMQGINALSKKAGHSGGKKTSGGQDGKDKANKAIRTADSGKNMNKVLDEIATENGENNTMSNSTLSSNSSNSIPYGDSNYSAEQERLDELTAEGFGEGDEEWDKAKAALDRHKLDIEPPEESFDAENIREADTAENEADYEEEQEEQEEQDNSDMSDEDKTHRLRAAMSLAGRWSLKGAGLAAKGIAKGTGAVTLGAVGVAAGLASDDYSNVLKYGAAGAAAGGLAVGAAIEKAPSAAYRAKQTFEQERDRYEEIAFSKAERKRRANSRADEQFLRDKATIQLYKNEFEKDYQQAMQDALEYRSYGITDDNTIIKAMKLKTKGLSSDRKDKRRILVAGAAPTMNKKEVDDYGTRLKSRGFSEKAAEDMKRAIRDYNDWA